jgi:hypothetical protein
MGSLLQDLRFALRAYLRRPLFTAISLFTLGVGIGTTSALFSVVDGVLIRELPYAEPGALVSVWQAFPSWRDDPALGSKWDRVQFTHRDYLEVRSASRTLTDLALFVGWGQMALTGSGAPERFARRGSDGAWSCGARGRAELRAVAAKIWRRHRDSGRVDRAG